MPDLFDIYARRHGDRTIRLVRADVPFEQLAKVRVELERDAFYEVTIMSQTLPRLENVS